MLMPSKDIGSTLNDFTRRFDGASAVEGRGLPSLASLPPLWATRFTQVMEATAAAGRSLLREAGKVSPKATDGVWKAGRLDCKFAVTFVQAVWRRSSGPHPIRRHSPSNDGRLSTPYGATFPSRLGKGSRGDLRCVNIVALRGKGRNSHPSGARRLATFSLSTPCGKIRRSSEMLEYDSPTRGARTLLAASSCEPSSTALDAPLAGRPFYPTTSTPFSAHQSRSAFSRALVLEFVPAVQGPDTAEKLLKSPIGALARKDRGDLVVMFVQPLGRKAQDKALAEVEVPRIGQFGHISRRRRCPQAAVRIDPRPSR